MADCDADKGYGSKGWENEDDADDSRRRLEVAWKRKRVGVKGRLCLFVWVAIVCGVEEYEAERNQDGECCTAAADYKG